MNAHRNWVARANALLPDVTPQLIVQSWERLRRDGLDPDVVPKPRVVAPDELQQRLASCAGWIGVVTAQLGWISRWLVESPHVTYFIDRDGILLHTVGDLEMARKIGLVPGVDWSEAAIGTNGAGTALVTDQPVAVLGREHYVHAFAQLSCVGVPVHHPDGVALGSLGLATTSDECSPEMLGLLAHAAYTVDQEFMAREFPVERRLREAAELARRAREDLLATVAHDLRSPLAVVTMGTALVRGALEQATTLEPSVARALERMQSASTRVERLVRDLLDFACLETGRLTIEAAVGDTVQIIQDSVDLMRPVAESKGVDLSARTPRSVTALRDPDRIVRVLLNLLSNAISFTSAGGEVVVEAHARARDLLVIVRDTGCGMRPQELRRLFESDYRPAGGQRRDSHGLGLTICRAIVEAHGGQIWAESEEGRGSAFQFTLPLRP